MVNTKNTTTEKLRALVLATLMIGSVFAGTIAIAGTAAANAPGAGNSPYTAGNFPGDDTQSVDTEPEVRTQVAVLDFGQSQVNSPGNVTSVDVLLNDGSDAEGISADDIDTVEVVLLDENNNEINSSTTTYDSQNVTLGFDPAFQEKDEVVQVEVYATPSRTADDDDDTDIIDAGVEIFAPDDTSFSGTSPYDTSNTQTIGDDTGTFVSARVTDRSNNPVSNATVDIVRGDTDTIVGSNLDVNNNGVTDRIPVVPDVEYTARGEAQFFSTSSGVATPTAGETRQVEVTLTRVQVPTNLEVTDVTPEDASVAANDDDTVAVTVNLTDQDGEPIENRDIEAQVNQGTDLEFDSGTVLETGPNGEVTFTVRSGTVQTADLGFFVQGGPEARDVDANRTVSFAPLAGEGYLAGQVVDGSTREDLEGAGVYAVTDSRFANNEFQIDETDDVRFFRLVNTSTGEVVDNDEYRVEVENDDSETERFVRNNTLNKSDDAVGEGFVFTAGSDIADDEGANGYDFEITPLERGNYTLQAADSESLVGAPFTAQDQFTNVSAAEIVAGDGDGDRFLNAEESLTFDQAENRSLDSGANLNDTTGPDGEFFLNRLSANLQDGSGYVVVAQAGGYTTSFADATARADGTVEYDDGQASQVLELLPEEVDAGAVDIENVGVRTTFDGTTDAFDNTSDEFAQVVPRDGTIDVLNVTTSVEDNGRMINGTAVIELTDSDGPGYADDPKYNLSGVDFQVEDGEIVDQTADSVTVVTGDGSGADSEAGKATLLIQTDQSSADLEDVDPDSAENQNFPELTNFTGITATLATDSDATDYTNKSFVGVTTVQTGAMNGLVRRPDNAGIDATVYLSELNFGQRTLEVQRLGENQYKIVDQNGPAESPVLSISEMKSYDFGDNDATDAFPRISLDSGVSGVSLLTNSTVAGDEAGSYTLSDVPAATGAVDSAHAVTAVTDNGRNGTSVTTDVEVDRTSAANVRIAGAEAVFSVSNLNPTNVTVQQGDVIDITADIENSGSVTGEATAEFRVGSNVLSTNTTTLAPGESQTVTFTGIDTENLSPGNYTHGVYTDNDQQTAQLTVTDGNNDGSGDVTQDQVIDAIVQYNSGGDISQQQVIDLIVQYNSQN